MYDHIGLKVKDVGASARFYQAALAPLGHVLASQDDAGAGFGPAGAPALWLYRAAETGSGTHVAFAATDRAAVDRFHAEGLKPGGSACRLRAEVLRRVSARSRRQQRRSGVLALRLALLEPRD